MSDGGLFEHRDGLRTLAGGAERLAIAQGRIGILGIGAIALAIDLRRTPRVGVRLCLGLWGEGTGKIGYARCLATAKPHGQNRRHDRGCKEPGKTRLLTHGTSTRDSQTNETDALSNRLLTLTSG